MLQVVCSQILMRILELVTSEWGAHCYSSSGCCLRFLTIDLYSLFIANISISFLDTGLTPQSLGFGPSFPSVTDTSQYDYNAYPLTYLIQTQQTNDLGYCWGTDIYDPNTDLCVDTAASLKYQTAHFVPIEAQNTDIDSISRTEDATTKNTTAEMEIEAEIETEGSTEWSCLENKVHSLEPESIVNTETQSGQQTPNASEPGLTALDNGKFDTF